MAAPTVGNHCKGTHTDGTLDLRLKCLKSDKSTYTCATWRYFLANCPKTNQSCSSLSGGFVAAVTVCSQGLW